MSNSDSNVSRRKLMGATSAAITAALAGCSQLGIGGDKNNGTTTGSPTPSISDFKYPTGFSETGINAKTALGKGSAMAGLASVRATLSRTVKTPKANQTGEYKGDFSQKNNKFLYHSKTSAGSQSSSQDSFFNDGTIFTRSTTSEKDSYEYTKREYQFNPVRVYNLSQVQQFLNGVTVSVDRIETRNGRKVAVYTASKANLSSKAVFNQLSGSGQQTYGQLQSANIEIVVDERGFLHTAKFHAEYKTQAGGENIIDLTFNWTKFNSVTVTKPDWVDSATFRDLTTTPKADVSFSETPGESVTVTVNSITEADRVDIVIGRSIIKRFTESGTKTIQASTYTTDSGEVATISVYAYKEGQQPTRIKQYTPQAPASGTTTTTPTTTTTNSSN